MQYDSPTEQLTPILLSAAMPGFGQFLQRRTAMAITQFAFTGLAWTLCLENPVLFLLVPLAHGLSALSAANYRQSLLTS
jgi:hypothetical protein